MPRIGVVGIPGKWSSEALADALEQRTGYRLLIDMGRVELDLTRRRLCYGSVDLCRLDGLVIKKISASYSPHTLDRLELLRVAQAAGVRIFSRPERILRLIDRLSCSVTLANAGIPMPETRVTEDLQTAVATVRAYGSAVFKPLYSTKARGMCLIDAGDGAAAVERAVRRFQAHHPVMYIQRRIELPGRDMGLLFLGGRYLGCYSRIARGDAWNTTIHSGGRYGACAPDAEVIGMAQRAQAPFGLDFTTVDVAESAQGAVVFEVSAFGGFRGALEGAGIQAASRYADYVLAAVEGPGEEMR